MNDRKKIDGMKVIFTEDDVQQITENVAAVLRSGHLIKGLFLDDFANRVTKRCSKTNAAMCSSDTSAMEMLFVALDVKGKVVVFQGNMFPSPIFACMRAGGIPMYADMELTGLGMAADSLLKVIDGVAPAKVGAVVVMHTAGIISPKFPEIVQVCDDREIPLIEDCAHAYGSTADGVGAGTWGDYAAFSFYATKPMCTGEGGAICSDNAVTIEAIDMLARYGKTEIFGAPFCEFPGYSNRMTELLAAVGVVTDSSLEKKLEKRRRIAEIYDKMLNVEGMIYGEPGQTYYKYVLLPDRPTDRAFFRKVMKEEFNIGIPAGVYDFPVYEQKPLIRTTTWEKLEDTETFCRNHICLPMHEDLTEDDAAYVAKAVNEVIG